MGVFSEPLWKLQSFRDIKKAIEQKRYPIAVSGCVDSQKGHLISNLADRHSCRLICTYREEKAAELYEDLCFFDRNAVLYPGKDLLFYSADIHGNHTLTQRMKILKKLLSGEELTIVTGIDVLMERMIPKKEFQDQCLYVDHESILETNALRMKLVELGYVSNGLAEAPGEFSIRGDIIDIFPLTEQCPVRIELWGDEVDSIRSFDAESQRSIENLENVLIYPAAGIILPKKKMAEIGRAHV